MSYPYFFKGYNWIIFIYCFLYQSTILPQLQRIIDCIVRGGPRQYYEDRKWLYNRFTAIRENIDSEFTSCHSTDNNINLTASYMDVSILPSSRLRDLQMLLSVPRTLRLLSISRFIDSSVSHLLLHWAHPLNLFQIWNFSVLKFLYSSFFFQFLFLCFISRVFSFTSLSYHSSFKVFVY